MGPSTTSTSLSKTRVPSGPTSRIQDEHLHTPAWHPRGSRIEDSSACQASDPGPRRPPHLPQHTHSLSLFCALLVGEEGGRLSCRAAWLGHRATITWFCPASKEWEDTFGLRCVWPLAPQGSVMGECRMEERPSREPRRRMSSCSWVEKREGPTVSFHLLCARRLAGLMPSSDPARQAWVSVSQMRC